jgi:hypothetical protein
VSLLGGCDLACEVYACCCVDPVSAASTKRCAYRHATPPAALTNCLVTFRLQRVNVLTDAWVGSTQVSVTVLQPGATVPTVLATEWLLPAGPSGLGASTLHNITLWPAAALAANSTLTISHAVPAGVSGPGTTYSSLVSSTTGAAVAYFTVWALDAPAAVTITNANSDDTTAIGPGFSSDSLAAPTGGYLTSWTVQTAAPKVGALAALWNAAGLSLARMSLTSPSPSSVSDHTYTVARGACPVGSEGGGSVYFTHIAADDKSNYTSAVTGTAGGSQAGAAVGSVTLGGTLGNTTYSNEGTAWSTAINYSFSSFPFAMASPGFLRAYSVLSDAWSASSLATLYVNGDIMSQGWIAPTGIVTWHTLSTGAQPVAVNTGDIIHISHTSLGTSRLYTAAVVPGTTNVAVVEFDIAGGFDAVVPQYCSA